MLSMLLWLMLGPPMPFYATRDLDSCAQVICPFTPQGGRVCGCAPAVINLGTWDPRTSETPDVWKEPPRPWGEYATERRD